MEKIEHLHFGEPNVEEASLVGLVDILNRRVPASTTSRLYNLAVDAKDYSGFVDALYDLENELLGDNTHAIGDDGIVTELLVKYIQTHSKCGELTVPILHFPVGAKTRDVLCWLESET